MAVMTEQAERLNKSALRSGDAVDVLLDDGSEVYFIFYIDPRGNRVLRFEQEGLSQNMLVDRTFGRCNRRGAPIVLDGELEIGRSIRLKLYYWKSWYTTTSRVVSITPRQA